MDTGRTTAAPPLPVLQFAQLAAHGVRHAVTLRLGGVSAPPFHWANLGFRGGDDPAAVEENRRRAAAAAGVELTALVAGQQVHGDQIREVTAADCGRGARGEGAFPATDALVTRHPEVALLVLTADCWALALYAPEVGALGVAHLGWRGVVAGLGRALVEALRERYGARPERLVGGLAPGIGPCCYPVGREVVAAVRARFAGWEELLPPHPDGTAFDLPRAILAQLAEVGVAAEQIGQFGLCTACRTDLFFSHRAEGGRTGRTGIIVALPR
ncbi:MAG: polyphenol oxidase family protein [Chloroflexi bacterium]|nr:polyphenol oxidase family protein [Chloroflexota bacterium]